MLNPAVRCTNVRCKERPPLRIPAGEAERYRHVPPNKLLFTYKCPMCGTWYPIYADAYQRAKAA